MYIGNQPYQVAFLTDTFSGNTSTTAFTMSVAPANTASVLVAVGGVLQDPSTYSVSGTTLTFSAAPPTGTGNISARYLGIPASNVTTTAYRTVTNFTATAGQTSFTPPSYTSGFINVYRNGVYLPTVDYTATNGTTVVLNNACTSGDTVTVESFLVSSVLNAVAQNNGSSSNQALTSPTITGGSITGLTSNLTFASGTNGIVFNNTNALVSSTLNDYEEGTYTITDQSGAGLAFTLNTGVYRKIGKLVYVQIDIVFPTTASANSAVLSLPFTSASSSNDGSSGGGASNYFNGAGILQGYIAGNTARLTIYYSTGGLSSQMPNSLASGKEVSFVICYHTTL